MMTVPVPREMTREPCLLPRKANETMLIYNMVPKCGSRGFREVIKQMAAIHAFYHKELDYGDPQHTIKASHIRWGDFNIYYSSGICIYVFKPLL